ncbi:MAG: SynChlorMet cassette protein ScmC [Deltaproteobacteria bacterium]|nr:SynChlorMet cassette protein ScmC [Deltaproteobacteria bacterium]
MNLQLAGDLSWTLIGTAEASSWVMKLSKFMCLKNGDTNGCPKIIFCRAGLDGKKKAESIRQLKEKVSAEIPLNGWQILSGSGLEIWSHRQNNCIICDLGNISTNEIDAMQMIAVISIIWKEAIRKGGIPLHAGLLEFEGRGVAIAANGGGGKTTCAGRLPSSWKAHCDDAALVLRASPSDYVVHPFPTWSKYLSKHCESTWVVEKRLPLSGIFFLEKAWTDEVIPLGRSRAAVSINQSAWQIMSSWIGAIPKKEKTELYLKLFENACALAGVIPAYTLRVSMTGRFWEKIEECLL